MTRALGAAAQTEKLPYGSHLNTTASHIPHTVDTHRCMHSRACLPLCWTLISLHVKEPTEGIFFSSFASICSTAPNQPTNQPTNQLQSSLPGLSKGRLLPNDHYELQSRRPGAPDQEPEIICTICEASNKRCVRLHHIFWPASVVCAYFVRSNSLVRLQQGDTTRRSILYLDRHDNQNAAEGGIISLCSLACSLASSASTCYAFGGSARSLTRLSHIHALMCAMQCASAYTRPPTHTHTHTHTLSSLWKSAFICYRGLENFKDLIADFCFASTERETPCQMAPEAETSTVTLRVRGYLKWDKQAAERGCDGFFFHPLFAPPWWKTGDLLTGWRKLCG